MTIISSRVDRRLAAPVRVPKPRAKRRELHRAEPWRDWAILALLNNAQLLIVSLIKPSWPWLVLAAIPFSVTLAIGTLTVLHDAGHRRFARNRWPNILVVHTGMPLGFFVTHWTLKHRVHHKASQVFPIDEPTRNTLVRMHPGMELKPFHRYQHLYAWFLYALAWVGELDSQVRYVIKGNVVGIEVPNRSERLRWFLIEKAICALVLLPYALLMGLGHLAVYIVVGMSLGALLTAIVLVVGHINEGLEPPSDMPSQAEWSQHLVRTTANFNTGSRPVRWLTGGMTHHLAHHLKPVAPRHQLPELDRTVVQAVVERSGLPLVEYPTLTRATISHYRRLRQLGRPGEVPVVTSGR